MNNDTLTFDELIEDSVFNKLVKNIGNVKLEDITAILDISNEIIFAIIEMDNNVSYIAHHKDKQFISHIPMDYKTFMLTVYQDFGFPTAEEWLSNNVYKIIPYHMYNESMIFDVCNILDNEITPINVRMLNALRILEIYKLFDKTSPHISYVKRLCTEMEV